MIHVLATIELHPGVREKFLAEFLKLKPHVFAEHGCIEYGAAIDVASGLAAQPPARPDTVVIIEKWTSVDTLKTHLKAPHMVPYREAVKGFVLRTALQVLEPAD